MHNFSLEVLENICGLTHILFNRTGFHIRKLFNFYTAAANVMYTTNLTEPTRKINISLKDFLFCLILKVPDEHYTTRLTKKNKLSHINTITTYSFYLWMFKFTKKVCGTKYTRYDQLTKSLVHLEILQRISFCNNGKQIFLKETLCGEKRNLNIKSKWKVFSLWLDILPPDAGVLHLTSNLRMLVDSYHLS